MNVYADLLEQGVMATGGRDGDFGVGGLFLGCGNTSFMGRRGVGRNSITNYEVVHANGTVVNANQSANTDLWKALRGGGLNFSLVSRSDLDALPANNLSYPQQAIIRNTQTPHAVASLVSPTWAKKTPVTVSTL